MALLIPRRFELKAYDRDLTLLGVLIARNSDAHSASFTVEHNGIGTGTVTLPIGHKMITTLMGDGVRLQFRYIDHVGAAVLSLSGPIKADSTALSVREGSVTFTCVSDEALLRDTLGWPVPSAGLGAQTSEYDTRTGAVDGICADIVVANLITRLGRNVRMVPFFADGQTATIKSRMQPILDVIRPALEAANRGIRLYQWNRGDPVPFFLTGQLSQPCVLVEMYTCQDRPYVNWTPLLGIESGTASATPPSVTRVVVGGQGEGTARTFQGYTEPTRETNVGSLGWIEQFVDARDATTTAELTQRASETFTEGSGTTSLDVSAVDGDPWIVGVHYGLGDLVRVTPVEGVTRIDKVRSITVTNDRREGIRITPKIGDPSPVSDPTAVLVRNLRDKGREVRQLQTRR